MLEYMCRTQITDTQNPTRKERTKTMSKIILANKTQTVEFRPQGAQVAIVTLAAGKAAKWQYRIVPTTVARDEWRKLVAQGYARW